MKSGYALVALIALSSTAALHAEASPAPDPIATRYAREIIETVLPPEKRTEMALDMSRALMSQMRDGMSESLGDDGVRQIVDSFLTKIPEQLRPATERYMPTMIEAMTQAYVREFSADELRQISAFAKTPAGNHYFSRSTRIMSDPAVAAANRTYFAETQQLSQNAVRELSAEIAGYLAKHPEVARKLAQQRASKASQP